jgi:hypothetical protein
LRQDGAALVVALMAMALILALGLSLALTTGTETSVAANVRLDIEAGYAADAAVEIALADLESLADWNAVLGGLVRSSFVDGPPSGIRVLADGRELDLGVLTGMLNCGRASCTDAEMDHTSAGRPWGPNNPRWQLFAHGPLARLARASDPAPDSPVYVAVWVADDPMESDEHPTIDATTGAGAGTVLIRAEAFGFRASRRAIEATLRREGDPTNGSTAVRMLSWREVS